MSEKPHTAGWSASITSAATVVFRMAEWLLVIAAFRYASLQLDVLALTLAAVVLGVLFVLYVSAVVYSAMPHSTSGYWARGKSFRTTPFLFGALSGALVVYMYFLATELAKVH